MKASTFFGLTVALLAALVVGVVLRVTGFFDEKVPPAAPPPPAVETVEVTVARKNIYEDIGIGSDRITTATLRVDDPRYQANKDEFIFVPASVLDRIPIRNIAAGEPIFKRDLLAQEFPDVPTPPEGMVAVNVAIPSDRALGGLIRPGQRVDVMLTSQIHTTLDPESKTIKSAIIARNAVVLTTYNRLMEVVSARPADQPIPFTLGVSPYQAALIEQAKFKGTLSLHLSQVPDGADLPDDSEKNQLILEGKIAVGDEDFAEVFHLEPIEVPQPPPPSPPPTPPMTRKPPRPILTRHFVGVSEDRVDLWSRATGRIITGTNRAEIPELPASPAPPPPPTPAPIVPAFVTPPKYIFTIPDSN